MSFSIIFRKTKFSRWQCNDTSATHSTDTVQLYFSSPLFCFDNLDSELSPKIIRTKFCVSCFQGKFAFKPVLLGCLRKRPVLSNTVHLCHSLFYSLNFSKDNFSQGSIVKLVLMLFKIYYRVDFDYVETFLEECLLISVCARLLASKPIHESNWVV